MLPQAGLGSWRGRELRQRRRTGKGGQEYRSRELLGTLAQKARALAWLSKQLLWGLGQVAQPLTTYLITTNVVCHSEEVTNMKTRL